MVCTLRFSEVVACNRLRKSSKAYRIKCEALAEENVRKRFVTSVSSKYDELPAISEDIEVEWTLFKTAIIASAAACCGRKRLRVATDSEKRTSWWNQDVKEAIRVKKDMFKS